MHKALYHLQFTLAFSPFLFPHSTDQPSTSTPSLTGETRAVMGGEGETFVLLVLLKSADFNGTVQSHVLSKRLRYTTSVLNLIHNIWPLATIPKQSGFLAPSSPGQVQFCSQRMPRSSSNPDPALTAFLASRVYTPKYQFYYLDDRDAEAML